MKKRTLWIVIAAALLVTVGVTSTLAWLVASSNPLENTFTVGNVDITLTESTGNKYIISPGVVIEKDPTVTVKKGSEACWVFVKLTDSETSGSLYTYDIADGWNALDGVGGVYYRKVGYATDNISLGVLKNDSITVPDTVTEQQLDAIKNNPQITVFAYAVQAEGLADAESAWQCLNS